MNTSGVTSGAVFRGVDRRGRVLPGRFSTRAFYSSLRGHVVRAGIKGFVATHSLRAGFVTTALERGVQVPVVMAHTRHKDPAQVAAYYRGELSDENDLTRRMGL